MLENITRSQQVVNQLAKTYGTMAAGQLQTQRKQFYSYIQYPVAGISQLNFFGQALGNAGANLEITNMPVQGSFGTSSFIVKGISLKYKLGNQINPTVNTNLDVYAGTDATTLATEIINGIFCAGIAELTINAKSYLQVSQPFQQMPPADGRIRTFRAGQTDANTDVNIDASLSSRSENKYICDPEIFIAAQQNFTFNISYPSGAVPIRASGVVNDSTNPLYVGVVLDGIEIRPVQ
jgi:hypothetical protein